MSACLASNSIDCDCTTSSLAPFGLTLPKNGNDFPFSAFYGGNNVSVEQSDDGISISGIREVYGFYVGFPETSYPPSLTSMLPTIFNDLSIPGAYDTGMYNTSTGEAIVPFNGVGEIHCQITTGNPTTLSISEFTRSITFYVNAAPIAPDSSKISFSNNVMTLCSSLLHVFTTGDILTVSVSIGNVTQPYTLYGGINTYLSFRQL